ncbi:MAG: hypothetical protein LBS59_01210 [Puniceicoccales bacterium]|jgi:hypothetical protein|nr:hypothetical protein [Puniceicoccales bacterium]
MASLFSRTRAAALLLALSIFAGNVHAAAENTAPARVLTQETAEKLVPAKELLDKNDFPALLTLIEKILAEQPPEAAASFDRALLSQLHGQILLNLNPPRYVEAIAPFETALALGERHAYLDNTAILTLFQTLSQLHYQNNDFPRALAHIETYIARAPKPSADIHLYAATLLYSLAEKHTANTTKKSPAASQPLFLRARAAARESLLLRTRADTPSLLLSLATHQQLGELIPSARLLETLLERDPKNATYHQQLFAIYTALAAAPETHPSETRRFQLRALVALERAAAAGVKPSTSDTQNRVALLITLKQYRAAAELLERSLANGTLTGTRRDYELLSATWQQQRNLPRAVVALKTALKHAEQKQPANTAVHVGKLATADIPNLHFALARLYYAEEHAADAYTHLQRATTTATLSHLEKPAQAWFLLTYIAYELRHFKEARQYAAEAAKYPEIKQDDLQKLTAAIDAALKTEPQQTSPTSPSASLSL